MASQVENDCDSVGEDCYYSMLGLFVAKSATWVHHKQLGICLALLDGDMLNMDVVRSGMDMIKTGMSFYKFRTGVNKLGMGVSKLEMGEKKLGDGCELSNDFGTCMAKTCVCSAKCMEATSLRSKKEHILEYSLQIFFVKNRLPPPLVSGSMKTTNKTPDSATPEKRK